MRKAAHGVQIQAPRVHHASVGVLLLRVLKAVGGLLYPDPLWVMGKGEEMDEKGVTDDVDGGEGEDEYGD